MHVHWQMPRNLAADAAGGQMAGRKAPDARVVCGSVAHRSLAPQRLLRPRHQARRPPHWLQRPLRPRPRPRHPARYRHRSQPGAPVMATICGPGTELVGNICTIPLGHCPVCGAGTTLVTGTCTALSAQPTVPPTSPPTPSACTPAEDHCHQGTILVNGGCVPDCADLGRRDIPCRQCPDDSTPLTTITNTEDGTEDSGGGTVLYNTRHHANAVRDGWIICTHKIY